MKLPTAILPTFTYIRIDSLANNKPTGYLLALNDCLLRLAEMPRLGRSIAQLRAGYFRFEHAKHTIFYTIIPGRIRVVRVLHQRMDPERHL